MNRRFVIGLIILIAAVIGISSISASRQGAEQKKIGVVASFYPFAEFARQVGGDKVTVTNITPVGAEPHDFEPSPQDIVTMKKAKVFIYSGVGLEPWADKVVPDLTGVTIINASEGIPLLTATPEEGETNAHTVDPHFYLDPVLDQKVVRTIANKLTEVDPANKAFYDKNADAYIEKLAKLDRGYRTGLTSCNSRDIVTSHAAFAYLAKRYHLTQIAIAGLSEEEPSPARLAEIARFVKEHHIKYIFFEKLVSPRLSETIARETGAKTLVLNPIEGLTPDDQRAGKNFISLMQDNLKNLRIALECR
ncbi:MAG TPA: metal ABC transporter substrate-binding protein [Anaerolineae bacterium]|nr:metal ABC transporter substrate-binding protein [Anaerolineae bacterium]